MKLFMQDKTQILEKLSKSIINGDEKVAKRATKKGLDAGINPRELIERGLNPGMEKVGSMFEARDYFIADLLSSSAAMQSALDILKSAMGPDETESEGSVVIGTVQGDHHDIGKGVVIGLLKCQGFEVLDLGTDLPPERFLEASKKQDADVVGLSGLLTQSFSSMDETIDMIKKEMPEVKVVVGGTSLNEKAAEQIGADAFASDAWKGLTQIKKFCEED